MPTSSNQVRHIQLTSQLLQDLLRLPKDFNIIRLDYDIRTDTYFLCVESHRFPEVPMGMEIPKLRVNIKHIGTFLLSYEEHDTEEVY